MLFRILRPHLLFVVSAFLLFSVSAFAQSVTARLSGTIKDEQGAVVPGAKVIITDPATRLERRVNTDSGGAVHRPAVAAQHVFSDS